MRPDDNLLRFQPYSAFFLFSTMIIFTSSLAGALRRSHRPCPSDRGHPAPDRGRMLMRYFLKHSCFLTGLAITLAQPAWAQSNSPPPSSSQPSSSHTHEQKCMNVKDRGKTGPCPLKDPSNKAIPGVAKRVPPPGGTPSPDANNQTRLTRIERQSERPCPEKPS